MPFTPALTAAWIAGILTATQPQPAPSADLGALVKQLGADDWATRQAADAELRAMELPGVAPLVPFLSSATLTPEQSARLRAIALEQFRHEPHAGMGVAWDSSMRFGAPRQSPVVIGQTVEGFDAAVKLRPGDAIVSMDGMPLPSQDEMRAAILSHEPGDTVTLSVFRGPMRLEVQITLGNFSALRMPEPPTDSTLARALELRLQRMAPGGILRDPVVIGGLSQAQWAQAGAHPVRPASVFVPGDDDELGGLLVGGEGHGGSPNLNGGVAANRPTIRLVPGGRGTGPGRPTTAPTNQQPRPAIVPPIPPKQPAARPPAPRPAPRPGA